MQSNILEKIKKQYEPLKKKYKLPEFSKLNEEFEIEKIQEKETEFILREIRRAMSEKIAACLRFFEMLVNPQLTPLFLLSSLKNLTLREKEIIEKIYRELAQLELEAVKLDISYNESKEAKAILQIMEKWQELKTEMEEIISVLELKHKETEKRNKTYFG